MTSSLSDSVSASISDSSSETDDTSSIATSNSNNCDDVAAVRADSDAAVDQPLAEPNSGWHRWCQRRVSCSMVRVVSHMSLRRFLARVSLIRSLVCMTAYGDIRFVSRVSHRNDTSSRPIVLVREFRRAFLIRSSR